jgi:hypothetical protein
MDNHSYWRRQLPQAPLFPDIEWSKPVQRTQAGRLGIIGGNKLGFAGVAESYSVAQAAGVGELRVLLPDVLRKTVPAAMTDVVFGASNPSGGLAKDAQGDMQTLGSWAGEILLIGDAGRNSETAIVYEHFLKDYKGPLVITRDAVDLIKNDAASIVERPQTCLVVSFAQLQKLFRAVYYPKILTFSMQLSSLVEALHKFTITYPVAITVFHKDYLVIAHSGNVTTTEWLQPMAIWRGTTATSIACYWLWNPASILEAATASVAIAT